VSRLLFVILICWLASEATAQVDSITQAFMRQGIAYSDQGQFDLAIIEFSKAIEREPKSGFIHYELALSYYYKGDLASAVPHAKKAMKEESEHGLQAVILLGSIYDTQGKYKQSIKVFEKGIHRFGDYYLIWYNLGVTAASHDDHARAEEAFEHAVRNKLDHANSHFALARTYLQQERRVEALYPLLFCAMVEPAAERSAAVYQSIQSLFRFGVSREGSDTKIELQMPSTGSRDAFRSAELMMSMLEASRNLEQFQGVDPQEVDREILMQFLNYMGKSGLGTSGTIMHDYYIPFFAQIANGPHATTFHYYIQMSASDAAKQWCDQHVNELEEMFDWLDALDLKI
jgi:Tfp pilus assembly protein PilF